jgi:uncharacterized membrane protein YbhN (UPF0104 family)
MRVGACLRATVSVVGVAIILWRVPLNDLAVAFGSLDGRWLWPALAAVLAMLAARWYRWQRLLAQGGIRVPPAHSACSLLGGFTLSVVTPGRVGEFGRCLFVARPDRASVLLLNTLDRGLDMWALATCAVASLLALALRPFGIFALGVWLALFPVAMALPHLVAGLGGLPWWGEGFRQKLRAAGRTLVGIQPAPFAALALLSTSLDMVTFFFLLRAFQRVDFTVALAVFPWIVLAAGLPVSVSGFGAREGAAALLLARYAIPSAVAFDVAIFFFAFSSLLPGLLGAVWYVAVGRTKGRPGWSGSLETLVECP